MRQENQVSDQPHGQQKSSTGTVRRGREQHCGSNFLTFTKVPLELCPGMQGRQSTQKRGWGGRGEFFANLKVSLKHNHDTVREQIACTGDTNFCTILFA